MFRKMEQNPAAPGFELSELIEQEESLIFDHFTQNDADRLAGIMLDVRKESGMTFGFEIYLNGMTVFKSMPEGISRLNDKWMERKLHTVLLTGWSTMRVWAMHEMIGKKRDGSMLPTEEYVMCGGGFPIRVKGAGVIGAIACSGPGDQNEHAFCVEVLQRFLHADKSED